MRPRKRILLIDANEDRKGIWRLVLEVRGYRVIEHARGEINLILAHWPIAYGIAKKLKKNNPWTPLVVIAPVAGQMPLCPHADAIWWESRSRTEMLESIHIMSARKKGPKRGIKRDVPTVKANAA